MCVCVFLCTNFCFITVANRNSSFDQFWNVHALIFTKQIDIIVYTHVSTRTHTHTHTFHRMLAKIIIIAINKGHTYRQAHAHVHDTGIASENFANKCQTSE